jgi:hypothetical protein
MTDRCLICALAQFYATDGRSADGLYTERTLAEHEQRWHPGGGDHIVGTLDIVPPWRPDAERLRLPRRVRCNRSHRQRRLAVAA